MVREYSDDCEFGPWICTNPSRDEPDEMLSRALAMIRPVPVEISCLQENQRAIHTLKANDFGWSGKVTGCSLNKGQTLGTTDRNMRWDFLTKVNLLQGFSR